MALRSFCALLLTVPAVAFADLRSDAVDRGRMSLAWDARSSGLCSETLSYLSELSPQTRNTSDALHLRVDCLLELGRHAEAVETLVGEGGTPAPGSEGLIEDVFAEWARDLTWKEQYGALRLALERGRRLLPRSELLRSEAAAARFRAELKSGLSRGRRLVRCADGEEVRVAAVRGAGARRSWIKAFPWQGEPTPVPRSTMAEWMGSWAAKLEGRRQALWGFAPRGAFDRFVREEAARCRLKLERDAGGFLLSRGPDAVFLDAREWTHRALTEGLGLRGAAAAAVAEGERQLTSRAALLAWVSEKRSGLELRQDADLLRLTNPQTGRSYDLDLLAWSASFDADSKEWLDFWGDLTCELERSPKAFECACGREAVLREALLPPGNSRTPGNPLLLERDRGYEVALVMVCPTYERYVTQDVLNEWGVDLRAAAQRARNEAGDVPWDLTFRRGSAAGQEYVVLRGEGASSLALREGNLLGALEAVEGAGVRATTVTAVVPTPSSLVVVKGRARPRTVRKTLVDVLLDEARRGTLGERLSYSARVRLPGKPVGTFRVKAEE